MTEREYQIAIILGLVDEASAGLAGAKKEADAYKEALGNVGTSLTIFGAAVTGALTLAVSAAAEEELAMTKLQTVVENNGYIWADAKIQIDDYINSQTILTKYSDDELIPALQKMFTYTNNLKTAQENLNIAVDFAASGMVDLELAVKLVGLAAEGNVTSLGKYIPKLNESSDAALDSMTSSEKAAYALEILKDMFGGMAENELNTLNGQWTQLKNNMDNLVEDIGVLLIPKFTDAITKINNVVNTISNWIDKNQILTSTVIDTALELGVYAGVIGGLITAIPKVEAAVAALWVTMRAHPLIAAAAAITGLVVAVDNYVDAVKEAHTIETSAFELLRGEAKMTADEWGKTTTEIEENRAKTKKAAEDDIVTLQVLAEEVNSTTTYQIKDTTEQWKEFFNGFSLLSEETSKKYIADGKAITQYWSGWFNVMVSYADTLYEYNKLMIDQWEEDQLDAIEKTYDAESEALNNSLSLLQTEYYANRAAALTTIEDADALTQELLEIDNAYYAAKAALEEDLSDKESQYVSDQEAIAEDAEEQRLARKRETNDIKKKEALVDGAAAIVKTFAEYGFTPWGIAAAAAVALQTDLQIKIMEAETFAKGVRDFTGGLALVGEEGPELVTLPQGSNVFTNRETSSMLGGTKVDIHDNYIITDESIGRLCDILENRIFGKIKRERFV